MSGYPEQGQAWRMAPPKGEARTGRPYLNAPGYLYGALNASFERRTARRRPHKRRLNHTAIGAAGLRVRREMMIPWMRSTAHGISGYTPSWNMEFWHKTTFELTNTGDQRIPVAFLGTREAEALGYSGATKVRSQDAPLVLNLARISGTWQWELYGHPGTVYITTPAFPYVRNHVSIDYDQATDTITLRVARGDTGAAAGVSQAGWGLQLGRYAWRFRGPSEYAANDADPPAFEFECIRLWHKSRSSSTIDDERDKLMPAGTADLVGQWTGDSGAPGYAESNVAGQIPMFFTEAFPQFYEGAIGTGMELANIPRTVGTKYAWMNMSSSILDDYAERVDVTLESLDTTAGSPLHSGTLQYGVLIGFRWLERAETMPATIKYDGLFSGQFEIAIDPTTGRVYAQDPQDPSKIISGGAINTEGEHTVAVRRSGTTMKLFVDGVVVATELSMSFSTSAALQNNKLGISAGPAAWGPPVAGSFLVTRFAMFYGDPVDAVGFDLFSTYPRGEWLDSIDDRVTGDVVRLIESYKFTDGSTSVDTTGATAPAVGDWLVVTEAGISRRAYLVTAVVGTTTTIHKAYDGTTGHLGVAVTRCLFDAGLDSPWDTSHNKTSVANISGLGEENFLPNVVSDRVRALRPLWLASAVNSATATNASLDLEETTRSAGLVKGDNLPAAGAVGYRRGVLGGGLVAWGSTLYWLTHGWQRDDKYDRLGWRVLNLDDGYLYPSNGRLFNGFAGGSTTEQGFDFDVIPGRLDQKRLLAWWGSGEGARRIAFYLDEGAPAIRIYYDNAGSEASVQLVASRVRLKTGVRAVVSCFLDYDSSVNSWIAVNGEKVAVATTGTWPTGANAIQAVSDSLQALFGQSQQGLDAGLYEEGFRSFVGYWRGARATSSEVTTLDNGAPVLEDGANVEMLLLPDEGQGWVVANDGTAKAANAAVNGASGAVPIIEDMAFGGLDAPYSMDVSRGTVYAFNRRGRGSWATWRDGFEEYPNGWESGKVGILPPKALPVVTEGSAAASSTQVAGRYRVAYTYLSTAEGIRSDPSEIIEITTTGANKIEIKDLQQSEDPRVDAIEVYMTAVGSTYLGKVLQVPAEAARVELDFEAEVIRGGDELAQTNGIPPVAEIVHFQDSRAYWAGIEGNEGVVTFSEPGLEESWSALNQLNIDSRRWSPVTGMSGQQGAVHVYTQRSMFRMIAGPGDITTFQLYLAADGAGCADHRSVQQVDGLDLFVARDGMFAFDGGRPQFLGAPNDRALIGVPGLELGADPSAGPLWSFWDPRRHLAAWQYRPKGDADPSGLMVVMSRRLNDSPSWSRFDLYDVSAAAVFDLPDERTSVLVCDSMGYAWALDDPADDAEHAVDLDGLGATFEDGTARTLVGVDGTNQVIGHQAGDGARGLTIMFLDKDANGAVTAARVDRLLKSPASSTLAAGDTENGFAVGSEWVLGGFPFELETSPVPYAAIEIPKGFRFFDAAFSPLSGEYLTVAGETASGRDLAGLSNDFVSPIFQREEADEGFFHGMNLGDNRGRAARFRLGYYGTRPIDVQEMAVRWEPQGDERGTGV